MQSSIKEKLEKICKERSGKLLSNEHLRSTDKVKLMCANAHEWTARAAHIIHTKSWCPRCSGLDFTIDDLKKLCAARDGKVISSAFAGTKVKHEFECHAGHRWNALPGNIKRGSWCPRCSKEKNSNLQKTSDAIHEELIAKNNGTIVTKTVIGTKKIWTVACDGGHSWILNFKSLRKGHWCKSCSSVKSLIKRGITHSIADCQKLAEKYMGHCLSKVYINSGTPIDWKCKEGHIWKACYDSIKAGSWCPACSRINSANKRHRKFEDAVNYAEQRGGRIVSSELNWAGAKTVLEWECKQKHCWRSPFAGMEQTQRWCPHCSGNARGSIEEMHLLASSRGGKCLSNSYANSATPMDWECSDKHIWSATPLSIKNMGTWCPTCAGRRKVTIEICKKIAEQRGGKCLSNIYDSGKKLRWKCHFKHEWNALFYSVENGSWCPDCSTGLSERICRSLFQGIFRKDFPKKRPSWLVSLRGHRMELDGYCEELNLAFEHQGRQHYTHISYFHENEESLKKRQIDDEHKRILCKKNGIKLVEIPEIGHQLPLREVQSYIIEVCTQEGVPLPEDAWKHEIDLKPAYCKNDENWLLKLQQYANSRGGKCLSQSYLGSQRKHDFECNSGHRWSATPSNILRLQTWCGKCSGKIRLNIDDMREAAAKKGGEFLSLEYTTGRQKYLWRCSSHHEFMASGENVRSGKWCPICARKKLANNLNEYAKPGPRNPWCRENRIKKTDDLFVDKLFDDSIFL
jgi:hypothetical protein